MVTRYDVISRGGQDNFKWKYMFFQLLSTIKVNLVAKIMQSAYLCVIIHVKQLPFLAVLTWFLILGKIQDGDYCWWRHRPPAAPAPLKYTSSYNLSIYLYTSSCFKILQHMKNSREGFHPRPPPPLHHGGGMNLRVRPRVNCANARR